MPTFHFDLTDGGFMPDLEGLDLADIPAARSHALEKIFGLVTAGGEAFWQGAPWMVEVRDDCGLLLFKVSFCASETPVARRARPLAKDAAIASGAGVGLSTA